MLGGVDHGVRERARDGIGRLAASGLDLADLTGEAARLLARVVPYDTACWHTVDPATLIETGYHAVDMPPPDAAVAEFAYLGTDFNTLADLAGGRRHSGVLSEATGGRLDRSPRYRELLRPNNIRGELRTALVDGGACWGVFTLFREEPRDFTADERDFAHEVAAVLGRGFRAAGTRARATGPAADLWPGVVLLDADRRAGPVTPSAARWLAELGDPAEEPVPFGVLSVAERVRREGAEVAARVRGRSGRWVQVLGAPAGDGVAVVLQAATTPSVAPLISAAYGLTARERELTDLVRQGCGTAEIAARLFISPHTVQGHLKAIFAKTGVRSRRELVTRVYSAG